MIWCSDFPLVGTDENDPYLPYSNNKIRLNTRKFYRTMLEKDLVEL